MHSPPASAVASPHRKGTTMELLTKDLEQRFARVKPDQNNPIVIAKFFNPQGAGTWWATEYDPEDRVFFGYASVLPGCDEWGYFLLDELQEYRGRFGLGIERDISWTEAPASAVLPSR